MVTVKQIQTKIGLILTVGTLLAAGMVIIGIILFLMQSGNQSIQDYLAHPTYNFTHLSNIWNMALALKPLGIIELGLIILILTQMLRVGLLVWFYIAVSDYYFTVFSLFTFIVMMFSFFSRVD